MKKTIEQTEAGYTIRTVNGVDTKTGAVWVRELREYTPLENGFNLELANDIYAFIEKNQELWDQGSWRRLIWQNELTKKQTKRLRKMLAIGKDITEPACGTAMCFAGWVSELTGADFVFDAKSLKDAQNYDSDEEVLDLVLVKLDDPKAERFRGSMLKLDTKLDDEELEMLRARGFSDETHRLLSLEAYAMLQLGLIAGDWRGLFGGENDLEDIRDIIDAYAEYGPMERHHAAV